MASWMRSRSFLIKLVGLSTATGVAMRLLYNASNAAENKKLVSVLMLTRHGARTPLHVISGIEQAEYKKDLLEPYVKAKYKLQSLEGEDFEDILSFYDQRNNERTLRGGVGRGQLTQLGEKQLFDLGRFIRNKYMHDLHFISHQYNPDEFYTRSTHYKRTINSAKSLLAGVYLKNHEQVPKEPFVIHIDRLHDDILFPNVLVCPYYSEARAFYEKANLLKNQEYVQNLNALIKALPKSNGDNANYNFTAFRDDILARKVHDLPVPEHLEKFLELSHRYGNMEITAQHDFDVRISIGMLLNLLKQNLLQSVDNDKKKLNQNLHKFRLFSAHDTTINAIMVAFGLVNDENHEWPPFAASIIIELWRNPDFKSQKNDDTSKYTIKFYYCTEPVSLPDCNMNKEKECGLGDFIKVMDRNTIEKEEFDKICNQKFAP